MPAAQRSLNWTWILARAFWISGILVCLARLAALPVSYYEFWLYDWHVYAAGARDLVDHQLYLVPLSSDYPIPVSSFNYPPVAALFAVPFSFLPDAVGGTFWVVVNIAAVGVAAVFATRLLRFREVWFWSGLAFCLYSIVPWAHLVLIGNNTPLVLLLVTVFVWAQMSERPTMAGTLLGVAIATKLWPATFLIVLVRERSARTIAWAVGISFVASASLLLWIGLPGVIAPLLSALSVRDQLDPGNVVLGVSWLRESFDWWPEWGGYAVCLGLLIIPARGLLGYGIATIAGMAAIPNLWRHYIPTIAFGAVLIWRGLKETNRGGGDVISTQPTRSPPIYLEPGRD